MSRAVARIVVRLDAASENAGAIDTAARLAGRAAVVLHGIFVEDEALLHLAALPFTRQITLGVGAQPFTVEDAELHLRAAAAEARHALLAAARRYRAEVSFEVVRGDAESALCGTGERDLIVASTLARAVAGHFRVESGWWPSFDSVRTPLLLIRHGPDAAGTVVLVLRDRGPAAARLIEAAVPLAETGGLTVIAPAAIAEQADFPDWLRGRIGTARVRASVETAPGDPARLRRRIAELGCRLLAVGADTLDGGPARLREFAEILACDVLVVR